MDSETLVETMPAKAAQKQEVTGECNGDFPSMGVDLVKKVNFKVAIFLFLIGIFIFSDIFIEKILPKKYSDGNCATTQGTFIQLLLISFSYIIIDLLVSGGLL
jgi:hypothetical protein